MPAHLSRSMAEKWLTINKKKTKLPKIDLHGYRGDDVFDALDRFLLNAARQGRPRAEIICGKGTGVVRGQVLNYLKKANYHWQFEQSPNGKPNEGSILVFLDE